MARSPHGAVQHLGAADPDALFVYLGNPDETSHRNGSIGTEYRDAIALADQNVGMLVDAIRARPSHATEDWLVLISTDHGRRADGGHGGDSPEEMTTFIVASGPATATWPGQATSPAAATQPAPCPPTFIVDVAATALDHLGIATDPAWQLDGTPLGASMLDRIREEGIERSQLPNTLSYMTDVIGERLTNSAAMDIPVTVEAEVRNVHGEAASEARNVIGEIPGTDLAHEVVMLGAHFDTWHASPNASDNTSGAAVMLEAVRILKAVGVQPRRTAMADEKVPRKGPRP